MDSTSSFAHRRPAPASLPPVSSSYFPPHPSSSTHEATPRVSTNEGLSPLGTHPLHSAGTPQSTHSGSISNSASAYSYQTGSWPTPGSTSSYVYSGTNSTAQDHSPGASQPSLSQTTYSSTMPATSSATRSLYAETTLASSYQPHGTRGSSPPPSGAAASDNSSAVQPPLSSFSSLPPYPGTNPSHSAVGSHQSQPPHPQNILSSQAPVSQSVGTHSTAASATSPTTASSHANPYHRTSHSQPSYYPPSSTPQQSFPSYSSPGLPTTQHATSSARSSIVSMPPHASSAAMQQPGQYAPRHYAQAFPPLPHTISGSVMTNLNAPNGPMSLLHNPMGPIAGPHHMYSVYGHPHSTQTNERPFRCDVCPQSFNRNHDLKRHKRIHLSVKPYPCNHCEKSFSRKDALKRHRLVKGCGEKDDPIKTVPGGTTTGNKDSAPSNLSPIKDQRALPPPLSHDGAANHV